VENLVRRVPEFLREGGWATMLCNWHHPTAAEWAARPVSWATGTGVDAWVVKLKTDDPRTYAANWLREEAMTEGEAAMAAALSRLPEWLKYYKSLNVGAISTGVVYLRKRTGAVANWTRADALGLESLSGKAGAQAQRLFDAETMLRGLQEAGDVLDQRLATCATCELVQRLRPEEGEWRATEAVIRQREGFEFPMALGALPAMLLAKLDGTRTAREVIQEMALAMKADPAVAYGQTTPFLAEMLRLTHVGV
jgi:hypothetical protein